MKTRNLTDVLADIPKNSEYSPLMVCARNGSLSYKPMMESVTQGTDIDTIQNCGTYMLYASCTPMPAGETSQGCILRVDRWDVNRVYHELIGLKGRYFRHKTSDGWSSWKSFTSSTVVGGGKHLSFNYLRNLAERRVA